MSVERNKDGSISIKSNNGVTVIGRMSGASDGKGEEKFKQWVEDCAKKVTACSHTFREVEQYFLEQCDALPLDSNDRRMKSFQINVIMNHCKDKLKHQAPNFSFDMTDEEIEKWREEDRAMHNEAINSSPEDFGLKMRGYYLPHTERNNVFYEEVQLETQKFMRRARNTPEQMEVQDICFFFEETTVHFQSSGGGRGLIEQLIIFKGVSEEDIEKRSPRFLGYISALRDIGSLPDFR